MLASVALVGCTDDVLENGAENNKQPELVRGEAYVNFTISTKTDSSRGINDGTTNNGDSHYAEQGKGADDSGHHVDGVRNENDINEVLVVITKVTDVVTNNEEGNTEANTYEKETNGMAKLYTVVKEGNATDKVANGYIGYLSGNALSIDTEKYTATMTNPVRLDYTGHYAIAVVVNPVKGLRDAVDACGTNHQNAYKAILGYAGDAYETLKDASGTALKNEDGSDKLSFQMSNKNELIVNATPENNNPKDAVQAKVSVERTVSKTTWRPAPSVTVPETSVEALKKASNVYAVNVNSSAKTPVMGKFWYKEAKKDDEQTSYDTYYYSEEFHKATTVENVIYWVLFKKEITEGDETKTLSSADYLDGNGQIVPKYVEAIFADNFVKATITNEDGTVTETEDNYIHIGVVDDTDKNNQDDENDDQYEANTGYSEKSAAVFSEDYAVASQVTEGEVQALTFVYDGTESKTKTYYVNLTHYALTNLTSSVYAVRHIENRQFGILADNEYLVTPTNTFKQTLAEVKDDASKVMNGVFTGTDFVALPTTNTDGTANSGHATTDKDKNPVTYTNVGGFMQYLYENSCAKGVTPTAENVTGIVLAGDIYDETGKKINILYKYNHRYFHTLQALLEDEANSKVDAFKALMEKYFPQEVKQEASDDTLVEYTEKVVEVPFTRHGGVTQVKCIVNGLPLHFIFDTGAADVTISRVEATFMFKNEYLSANDVIGKARYMDANGDISIGTVLNIKKITFGGLDLENVRASVVESNNAPLLLGQSVLNRLGKIEIDYDRSVLKITTKERIQ